ncbi:transcription-repair coupling factor [Naumannella halotolerans]|uniref:Transcription-repair-coupling factor n=1 Tax=Naumannella halotolerans TaxID=993414 RepID=A0A4R7J5T5_9ACTN|nr:transcription-repair coupling factor [Naumannella halotolerans]TDT32535.1 transcription-repair coupling factor (superfamily II helicase) [Naumannella halotolerans]
MSLSALVSRIASDPVLSEVVDDARRRTVNAFDLTGPPALRPFVVAALAQVAPVLLVTSTYREAENVTAVLGSILDPDDVAYYPAWETLPHERLSPRSDTVGRRLSVLRRFAGTDEQPPPKVVIAPVRSLLQPQVKGLGQMRPVRVEAGSEHDPEELARDLVAAAYTRVDLVERRGEFTVRGGILDVFSPTSEHPVRIDFFGDTVEEIRSFTVADQRSFGEPLAEFTASPCREMLITEQVRERALALLDDHPELSEMLEKIALGTAVEGMESLAPALVEGGMELMIDALPDDTIVLIADPELIRGRAADLVTMSQEFLASSWQAAAAGGKTPIDLAASAYRDLAQVRAEALDRGLLWWTLSPFSAGPGADEVIRTDDGEVVDLSTGPMTGVDSRTLAARAVDSWRGNVDAAIGDIRRALTAGWQVVLAAEGTGLGKRMVQLLGEHEIPARLADHEGDLHDDVVNVIIADLAQGFVAEGINLAVFTAADLSGQRTADKSQRKMPARRKNQIDPLQLSTGDSVVHEQHGVGRYIEMVQRTIGDATREYLVIEYAPSKRGQPGDRLFVPMDQLDQVTRYVGGENPTLDKMGGADWAKRKGRARKAVRQIAAELIKLYAARQASRGHAFGPDTTWQRELEDAFNYVETPDQLAAITEVKQDMEQIVPMDRLICGDVGYGKTEIAVRAAFKAVQDGKQVAVLVPTTLLVQQHYATFADRYAGFPVRVAGLSRFQTEAEAKKVREGVADGSVDVVVGTHRLLSGEVEFKDLGLVIIDEEQRFGVEHKEALKRLRMDVDVLAMSATPIPRTLEMAITGIREMSTIATPPEERHPVLTFAGPYEEAQVAAAIRRELMREGQVFFIHNRVQSIEKTAKKIAELVPEAKVVTAHGQMGEAKLEQVMVDFWERRADVLVCTTIVEAGLDISTANTLIIERADLLGLSQLHQLRGRVGRGRERGYAYFLYPPDRSLTETAHDRLATMTAHSDLGAGMQIAMKDLEIRGAGNLLGGEQSGHIADVGFDLYIRLVGEAVADFRGEGGEPEPEVRIELPVDAHLPEDYIETERLRLEMYKRLAETRTPDDLSAVVAEMTDRYGEPTGPVLTLIDVARFRLAARAAGLREVVAQGNFIRFGPAELPDSRRMRLKRLHPRAVLKEQTKMVLIPRPRAERVGGKPPTDVELLQWASKVVEDIFAPVLAPAAG